MGNLLFGANPSSNTNGVSVFVNIAFLVTFALGALITFFFKPNFLGKNSPVKEYIV